MPSPSDANHTRHMLKIGAVVWNSRIVMAPPMAAIAAPMVAASRKPKTRLEIVELERWTEPPDDEPRCEYGLAGIAKAAEYRGPNIPVAQEIGSNGCDDDADRHRPPRARPQGYQDAGGDARSGPEDRHTFQFGTKHEAQPRTEKIGDGGDDAVAIATPQGCCAPKPRGAGCPRRAFAAHRTSDRPMHIGNVNARPTGRRGPVGISRELGFRRAHLIFESERRHIRDCRIPSSGKVPIPADAIDGAARVAAGRSMPQPCGCLGWATGIQVARFNTAAMKALALE